MRTLAAIVGGIALTVLASSANAGGCTYDFKFKAAKEVIGPVTMEIYSSYEEHNGAMMLSGLVETITPVIRTQKGPLIEGNYAIALEDVGSGNPYGKVVSRELKEGSAVKFNLPKHATDIRFAKEQRYPDAIRHMLSDKKLTFDEVKELNLTLKQVDSGNQSLMLIVSGHVNECDVSYNLPIVLSTEQVIIPPQAPAPAIGRPERQAFPPAVNVHIENTYNFNMSGKEGNHRKRKQVSSIQELSLGYLWDQGKFNHDTLICDCRLEQEETLTLNALLLRYGATSPDSRVKIEGGPAWSRDETKSTFFNPDPRETGTSYDGFGVVGRFSADGRLMHEGFSPEVGVEINGFSIWNKKDAIPKERQFGMVEGRLGLIGGHYDQFHAGASMLGGLRVSDDARYMFIRTKSPVIESAAGFKGSIGDRDNFDASVSVYSVFPVDNSPVKTESFLARPQVSAELVLKHVFANGWFIRGEGGYSHESLKLVDKSDYDISDGSASIGIGKRW